MTERGLRKERSGLVVSDRMQKTVVVSVERTVMDPRYKKILRRRTPQPAGARYAPRRARCGERRRRVSRILAPRLPPLKNPRFRNPTPAFIP